MKITNLTRLLALLLCLLTLTACFAACSEIPAAPAETKPADTQPTEMQPTETQPIEAPAPVRRGEGATEFLLTVPELDGSQKQFEIHTDAANVAEALLALGLVAGDDSEYGLYIKVVDGVTADYSVDKTYWSLLVNGEYSQVGASSVPVSAGLRVELKKEKSE